MSSLRPQLLLALLLVGTLCGCGGKMAAPTVTGIFVKATPSNQTAYSTLLPPQNQVSFAAYLSYSDASLSSTALSGVQWSDIDYSWVFLNKMLRRVRNPLRYLGCNCRP